MWICRIKDSVDWEGNQCVQALTSSSIGSQKTYVLKKGWKRCMYNTSATLCSSTRHLMWTEKWKSLLRLESNSWVFFKNFAWVFLEFPEDWVFYLKIRWVFFTLSLSKTHKKSLNFQLFSYLKMTEGVNTKHQPTQYPPYAHVWLAARFQLL